MYHCCLQVQGLIELDARSEMEKNETKLESLVEAIEHLHRNIDYESTIQRLEVGRSG